MAKVTMPAGPTRLQKNMAVGMSLKEAESKALGKSSPAPKTTRK